MVLTMWLLLVPLVAHATCHGVEDLVARELPRGEYTATRAARVILRIASRAWNRGTLRWAHFL